VSEYESGTEIMAECNICEKELELRFKQVCRDAYKELSHEERKALVQILDALVIGKRHIAASEEE